jgi:hypothetical protein
VEADQSEGGEDEAGRWMRAVVRGPTLFGRLFWAGFLLLLSDLFVLGFSLLPYVHTDLCLGPLLFSTHDFTTFPSSFACSPSCYTRPPSRSRPTVIPHATHPTHTRTLCSTHGPSTFTNSDEMEPHVIDWLLSPKERENDARSGA